MPPCFFTCRLCSLYFPLTLSAHPATPSATLHLQPSWLDLSPSPLSVMNFCRGDKVRMHSVLQSSLFQSVFSLWWSAAGLVTSTADSSSERLMENFDCSGESWKPHGTKQVHFLCKEGDFTWEWNEEKWNLLSKSDPTVCAWFKWCYHASYTSLTLKLQCQSEIILWW